MRTALAVLAFFLLSNGAFSDPPASVPTPPPGAVPEFSSGWPNTVPDPSTWMNNGFRAGMTFEKPVTAAQAGSPLADWLVRRGVCPNTDTRCEYWLRYEVFGVIQEHPLVKQLIMRVVVKHDATTLECVGYQKMTSAGVQMGFWTRSGQEWALDPLDESDRDGAFLNALQEILIQNRQQDGPTEPPRPAPHPSAPSTRVLTR